MPGSKLPGRAPANSPFGSSGTPHVVIVGAGFGGIATAVKLQRAGMHTFTVFEKSDGPGGTWWDNRYPGAEVDVASHLYSYSFKSYDWSRTHARQEELQRYLEEVIDDYGIRPTSASAPPSTKRSGTSAPIATPSASITGRR